MAPQSVELDDQGDAMAAIPAPSTSSGSGRVSTSPRLASRARRAPAQIVIANYDFLRHDLRLLALLAPTLVVVLVVASFVIH